MAYPIVFFGVRDGCLDMFEVPFPDQTPELLNRITFVLLSILTVTAVFVTDLGLINAVGGGLIATSIVFVFPTLMFHRQIKRMAGESLKLPEFREVHFAMALTVVGVVMGLIGAWTAVVGGKSA
jgi:sodium-coupled neutral amino acid transporter 11